DFHRICFSRRNPQIYRIHHIPPAVPVPVLHPPRYRSFPHLQLSHSDRPHRFSTAIHVHTTPGPWEVPSWRTLFHTRYSCRRLPPVLRAILPHSFSASGFPPRPPGNQFPGREWRSVPDNG